MDRPSNVQWWRCLCFKAGLKDTFALKGLWLGVALSWKHKGSFCYWYSVFILHTWSLKAPGAFPVLTLPLVQVQGIIYRQLSPCGKGRKKHNAGAQTSLYNSSLLLSVRVLQGLYFLEIALIGLDTPKWTSPSAFCSWSTWNWGLIMNALVDLPKKKIGLIVWHFQDCIFYSDTIALPVDVQRVWVKQVQCQSANVGLSAWRLIPPSWICSVYLTQWLFDTQKQSI